MINYLSLRLRDYPQDRGTRPIKADEAERLVRAYNLDHAKEMITRAVQMRRQVAQKGPLLAQVGYEETDGR